MTYGTVGEGKSLFGQLFWVLFEIFGLVFVATYMSFTGAWLGWNVLEWDSARFGTFLSLLMGGLVFYVLLVTLARTILLLRHWRQPLVEIGDSGVRMRWIFRGVLRWADIAGVEKSGGDVDGSGEDKQGEMEPHIIIRLKSGSNFEYQGLPLWRARSITLPVARPAELAAMLTGHPGYRGSV